MKHIAITKTEINGADVNSVNARDLHKALEVKTPFSMWIERAVKKYSFLENEDFTIHSFVNGKAKQTDYIITMDMAKELAMLENNKKGREARKYFIDIEKQHNQNSISALADQNHKIKALLVSYDVIGEVVTEHDKRINNLEQNRRLEAWQEKALLDAKNSKVYELAPEDKDLQKKLHGKVWSVFKKRFHLPRYNELKTGQYENGLEFIYNLTIADMVA